MGVDFYKTLWMKVGVERQFTRQIALQIVRPHLTGLQCLLHGESERPTAGSPACLSSSHPPLHPVTTGEHVSMIIFQAVKATGKASSGYITS